MKIKEIKKVTVKYNEKTVGYLAQITPSVIGFQYDEEWQKNGFSVSPLSLPLSDTIYTSGKEMFGGLYGVFFDSLPDGWGELLLNRFLSRNGINPERLSVLTKLSLIGKNGLGGLTYEPSQPYAEPISDVNNFDTLSKAINDILNDSANENELDEVYALGGSSGGARPKAHIKIDGEEWIVKFACRIDPENVGSEEYKANETAKKCGIQVNEFRMFPSEKCTGYFGTKRFDRTYSNTGDSEILKEKRLHMVSLSALLETTHKIPNLDYMHLFQVIQEICVNPKEDMYETYRRMCFNVFYKNKDDHGKNFSFLYHDGKKGYVLSPAYDLTKTPEKFEHEMTVNGNGNPSEKDLLAVAEEFKLNLAESKEIIRNIRAICEQ